MPIALCWLTRRGRSWRSFEASGVRNDEASPATNWENVAHIVSEREVKNCTLAYGLRCRTMRVIGSPDSKQPFHYCPFTGKAEAPQEPRYPNNFWHSSLMKWSKTGM